MHPQSRLLIGVLATALLIAFHGSAAAQVGQLRGHVVLKKADGSTERVAGATIDVFRVDLPGKYETKTDKRGNFVFAGLPFIGTYIIAASAPNARPQAVPGVRAGRDIDYKVELEPGDGRRLTAEEAKAFAGGSAAGPGAPAETAEAKARREEMERKAAEIEAANEKIRKSNVIVARAFKAGNDALLAKRYDEAIQQYDEGLAADPEQPALLTNKSIAHRTRGVDRHNQAVRSQDAAEQKAGMEAARNDFRQAAEASSKAVELMKRQGATGLADQATYQANRMAALSANIEAMRLYVPRVDNTKVDQGYAAYQEYLAAEIDPAKKLRAQLDLAQMLFDSGATDRSVAEFQKVLSADPENIDAILGLGLALFGTGERDNYQEAANYLQKFVDKAPDSHPLKASAKESLDYLKTQENVKPEPRRTTPARRRG